MSKKILALVLSAALALSLCLTPALAASSKTYPDAVGNWAEKSIARWSSVGIVTGDDAGLVHPGQYLRRCELATILVRLLGLSQRAADNTFTDVPAGAWYADAILKCAAAGIMEGYDGRADPEDNITREQAITMIGRALGAQSKEGQSLAKYRDADSAFAYSKGYLSAFTAMGILNGVGDGSRVAPKQSIDRASAFTLLDRAIGAYVTTPGVVELHDENQFVVINAATAGDVTVTGKCAGVLITTGNRAGVKLSRLSADTVKVDAPVKVEVLSSSKLGYMDLNAPAAVEVADSCTVGSINADDATKNGVTPTIKDQSASTNKNNTSSGGGGGGGGYRPSPSASPSQRPGTEYSIALDAETVSLKVGETKTVTATVTPAGAEVSYTISPDTGVVAVDIRDRVVTVTALKVGTASVRVAVTNGPSKSILVTVTAAGEPSASPSTQPSASPSTQPSASPSTEPSASPSTQPSASPSTEPSAGPSTQPSASPSTEPSASPSTQPSASPSTEPSASPSTQPSASPSTEPSTSPSTEPSTSPSTEPSPSPSAEPSAQPSPSASPEPGDVTVTLRLAGDAADAVESVTLQGVTGAAGVYTVKADTDVTVVVTLKEGKDAGAYTVNADTDITFTAQGNTFTGTPVKAAADLTITVTVTSIQGVRDELWLLMVEASRELSDTSVPQEPISDLRQAIDDAFAVHQNASATLGELQEAKSALSEAIREFYSYKGFYS